MSKLSQTQKEQLKRYVMDCTVRRLSIIDTQQYIKEKIGVDISTDYLRHVKADLRKDSEKQLAVYQKDKFAYIEEVFFKPVAEFQNNQDVLRDIIANNADKPEAQIKAVAELNYITIMLRKLFEILPFITRLGMDAFIPPPPPRPTITPTLQKPLPEESPSEDSIV